jgi:hypothetical protein
MSPRSIFTEGFIRGSCIFFVTVDMTRYDCSVAVSQGYTRDIF